LIKVLKSWGIDDEALMALEEGCREDLRNLAATQR